jgi:hypothetical protein
LDRDVVANQLAEAGTTRPVRRGRVVCWNLAPALTSAIHLLSVLLCEPADSRVAVLLLRRAMTDHEVEAC